MVLLDHLGITVVDLHRGFAQFDPVLTALGYVCDYHQDDGASWSKDDETEMILFPVREVGAAPHRHGLPGWQHLAFAVPTPAEVDRLHRIAVQAGWTTVRAPKPYPRYNERYYASFAEDDSGIRLEFMFNPPRDPSGG